MTRTLEDLISLLRVAAEVKRRSSGVQVFVDDRLFEAFSVADARQLEQLAEALDELRRANTVLIVENREVTAT